MRLVIRRVLLTVAGVAWMVTLPMAADALLTRPISSATIAFVPAAIGTAGIGLATLVSGLSSGEGRAPSGA